MNNTYHKISEIFHLLKKCGSYSFEIREILLMIIQDEDNRPSLYCLKAEGSAESNGRPKTHIEEWVCPLSDTTVQIMEANLKGFSSSCDCNSIQDKFNVGVVDFVKIGTLTII